MSSTSRLANAERIRRFLDYNSVTGEFRWKAGKRGSAVAGALAGGLDRQGYVTIRLDKVNRMAHRLAWLLHYGEEPGGKLTHINGRRDDNRIENLSLVDGPPRGELTRARLHELLSYDPATGEFRWNVSTSNRIRVGSVAGVPGRLGYIYIGLDGKRLLAHRLAWFYVHGRWPTKNIDHIDGNPSNNQISNLRECDQRQNSGNARKPRHNTSGYKGVSWSKAARKWTARIGRRHLGLFECPKAAHAAYMSAATKKYGEFARAG